MTKAPINHIWFDFSETIAFLKKEKHDRLRYETYAEIVGKPVDDHLISEYDELYKKFDKSNSAIFRSLGQTPNFWSDKVNTIPPNELYELANPNIPEVLAELKTHVPISIFSNIQIDTIFPALGMDAGLFTHIINSTMVKEPKPALDGFYKMIELNGLPAGEILYIGDDVRKDIRPAKQLGIQTGMMWGNSTEADYSFSNFREILELVR